MNLKKANAILGLLSIVFLLIHMGYSVFAYLTFYYNPFLKMLLAVPFMVMVCLHALLGMLCVFTQGDGTRMKPYGKLNMRTLLQRISAALIFPLLILHINTFTLMKGSAEKGWTVFIFPLIAGQILFFAITITHVVISLSKGLITLGLLSSRKTQQRIDLVAYICGAIFFVIAIYAVVKGEVMMFLMG